MKVLVVDDSRSERKVIRYNFEWHGCQVLEACNGRQGLDLALSERPDLVVSDCLMPIMDGFQFLHELRKHSDLKRIPFVFYSAVYTGSREAELAASLGASAFMEKPKTPEEFWGEVGRVLATDSAGEASVAAGGMEEDDFLRNYGQVVAGKLEEKVRELSEANSSLLKLNAELEQRVVERTAQLEEANRELETFSYSVSHDLRAPLRHIDGFSQALADDFAPKLDTMGKEYLDRIKKSSKRMLEMIDALLELSRIGRGKLAKENVDVTALAREIGAELAAAYPERTVSLDVAEGITARGDVRQIRVALQQLLDNAWKFTGPVPEPHAEVFPVELEGKDAIAVRDNGVGFDMSYADKLFSPFQRLHTPQEFPGLGVGLAIARRIVNRHGGRIKIDSELDKGTTVTFTL